MSQEDLMGQTLYLEDCYRKEFEATVVSVTDNKYVVLDQTAFYPSSGGQPHDTGVLLRNAEEFPVIFTAKVAGTISHEIGRPGLQPGDHVIGTVDWNRRYTLMRYHTAAHILSEVIHKKTGAKVTGNQLDTEKGRIDFDLENYNKDEMKLYEQEANAIIQKGIPVKKYFMDREAALENPELFSLKNVLPPEVKELRIVEVEGFDTKACGGCHVDNTREIGPIEIVKSENKGKNNRRLVFVLGSS